MKVLHEWLGGSEVLDLSTKDGIAALSEITESVVAAGSIMVELHIHPCIIFNPTEDATSIRQFTVVSGDFEG